jgi:hypothetical protein
MTDSDITETHTMTSKRRKTISPLPAGAKDAEVVRFLDSHDPEELERQGIMVREDDRDDLEAMLKRHMSETKSNTDRASS